LDFLFLVLLACNSGWMIYKQETPPWQILWATRFFVVRAGVNTIIMIWSHIQTLGCSDGFFAVVTRWNVVMMIVELSNAINLMNILVVGKHSLKAGQKCIPTDHHLATQHCALVLYPAKFAIAIGLKWIHFILELLNTKGLGNSVLPAFKAVTGTDAMAFMAFLMLVVFATVQTYWGLPIAEHLPEKGKSVFALVFMKIFRLELLGDFDISELEGEDPQITGTWNGNQLHGEIGEAHESPLFHDAVMVIALFASVVVTVLSMNVAIGVVSTAYSENKANSNQLYCHFQAGYVFKLLLRRAAFRKVWDCLKCHCVKDCPGYSHPPQDNEEGYFIGFDERWFMDSKDLDEEFEVLQNTIESNRQQLDSIENDLLNTGEATHKSKRGKVKKRR